MIKRFCSYLRFIPTFKLISFFSFIWSFIVFFINEDKSAFMFLCIAFYYLGLHIIELLESKLPPKAE